MPTDYKICKRFIGLRTLFVRKMKIYWVSKKRSVNEPLKNSHIVNFQNFIVSSCQHPNLDFDI